MRKALYTFVALCFLGLPVQVFAFNLLFLKDSPVAEFDSVDTGLMVENFYHAMDNLADGEVSAWKNEDSGHNGLVELSGTEVDGETTCRNVRIENHASVNSAVSSFRFCRQDGGRWEISPG